MTRSRSVDSWLIRAKPPLPPEYNGLGWDKGEAHLWWAVVVQSSRDLLTLSESEAYDAAEWLKDSGAYLIEALYGVPVEETRKELAHLIKKSPSLRRLVRGV